MIFRGRSWLSFSLSTKYVREMRTEINKWQDYILNQTVKDIRSSSFFLKKKKHLLKIIESNKIRFYFRNTHHLPTHIFIFHVFFLDISSHLYEKIHWWFLFIYRWRVRISTADKRKTLYSIHIRLVQK